MKDLRLLFGNEKDKQSVYEKYKNTLLIDFSNIFWSSFYIEQNNQVKLPDENEHDFFIYLLFKTILSIKKSFSEYNDIVFAIDSGSWRIDYFKYYKAKRKMSRQGKDKIKFEKLFETVDYFLKNVKPILPYKFIKISKAEADDIIGILTISLKDIQKNILIISRDKDFKQLLKYPNVKLFDPITKKWLVEENPEIFILQHIIQGDSTDGIPNILSDDNIFLQDKKRQCPITKKLKQELLEEGIDNFVINHSCLQNYKRNKKLIELSSDTIPKDIQTAILYEYNNYQVPKLDIEKLSQFMKKHNIKTLLPKINEFYI